MPDGISRRRVGRALDRRCGGGSGRPRRRGGGPERRGSRRGVVAGPPPQPSADLGGNPPDRRLPDVGDTLDVDVSQAFTEPDGDALTYAVSSSAPRVVTVLSAGAQGHADRSGRRHGHDPRDRDRPRRPDRDPVVHGDGGRGAPFADAVIRPGVTPGRAVHFTEAAGASGRRAVGAGWGGSRGRTRSSRRGDGSTAGASAGAAVRPRRGGAAASGRERALPSGVDAPADPPKGGTPGQLLTVMICHRVVVCPRGVETTVAHRT